MKALKFTLIITVLLFFSSALSAQHWNRNGIGATAADVCIVDLSSPNDNIVWGILSVFSAGTCGGQVPYVTKTVNGSYWVTTAVPLPADVTPVCISAINATTAWIACSNIADNSSGTIYQTTDGGITWRLQPTANFADAVRFVHFYDPNIGVAVGDSSVFTTTNGGLTWTFTAALPVPSSLIGTGSTVFLLNSYEVLDNTIWLGDTWGFFYKSLDKGLTWTRMPNDIFPSAIKGIAFRDQNYGIAVASQVITGGSGGPPPNADSSVYTTDGGLTWHPMIIDFYSPNIASGLAKYDIAYVPGTLNTFVVTSEYDASYAAFSGITTDGGLTWSLIDSTEQHTVCVFTGPNNGYTGGYIPNFSSGIYRWSGLLPTSLDENEKQISMEIYPNPVIDVLTVKLHENVKNAVLNIMDVSGKNILTESVTIFNDDEIKIDVSDLAKGVYILQLITDGKEIQNQKFIR